MGTMSAPASTQLTSAPGFLYTYFFRKPSLIPFKEYRFYLVANISYHFAAISHFTWIILFWLIDVKPLAIFNIFSVGLYVINIIINRKGYYRLTTTIGVLEIIAHQLLGSFLIGYDAGFSIFLLVVSIYPFMMPAWKGMLKAILFSSCLTGYLVIDIFMRHRTPVYLLDNVMLDTIYFSNVLFGFIILALMFAYFHYAVTVAESKLELAYQKSEDLLLNILPKEIAEEIKENGRTEARQFDSVTVLFADIENFTRFSENLPPAVIVSEIDITFKAFDEIIGHYNIEKIKTIGDAYMCASGIPLPSHTHAVDMVRAAISMQEFVNLLANQRKHEGKESFAMRIGIHTGPVVAGVVGMKKFVYDIWGDTVNIAARMQTSSEAGRINISGTTFNLVKDHFECTHRGKMEAKHKGMINMYYVDTAPVEKKSTA